MQSISISKLLLFQNILTSNTDLREKAISLVDGLIKSENRSIAEIGKELITGDSLMGRRQRGEVVGSPGQPAQGGALWGLGMGCEQIEVRKRVLPLSQWSSSHFVVLLVQGGGSIGVAKLKNLCFPPTGHQEDSLA